MKQTHKKTTATKPSNKKVPPAPIAANINTLQGKKHFSTHQLTTNQLSDHKPYRTK
jgi:hypothetical protein